MLIPIDANYCPYCGSKILAVNDVQKLLCTVFGLTLGESSLQEVAKVCELIDFTIPGKLRYKHPKHGIYYTIDKQMSLLSNIDIYNLFNGGEVEKIGRIPDEWKDDFGYAPSDWTVEKVIPFFQPYFERYEIVKEEKKGTSTPYYLVYIIFESSNILFKLIFDNHWWNFIKNDNRYKLPEREYVINTISLSLKNRCQ